jgi:outer membrane protein, multidrug efflux system
LPVATSYPTGDAYKGTDQSSKHAELSAAAIGWRDFFTDKRLQALIDIALRNNRELRMAALNVQAAQAQYRVQRSDLFPQIGLNSVDEFGTLPESTALPISGSGAGSAAREKKTTIVCTAIARELVGFMWSIGREVQPRKT